MDTFEKVISGFMILVLALLTVLAVVLVIEIFTDDTQQIGQCSEGVYLFSENGEYSIQERKTSTSFIIIDGRPHPTINTTWDLVAKFRERTEAEAYCENFK